jgi:hypothetical protein
MVRLTKALTKRFLQAMEDPVKRARFERHPIAADLLETVMAQSAWAYFRPRPDRPEAFDQQSSFINNRDPVSFLIGGNAAGTTEAASCKLARFVLNQQEPPRKDTPFWIISNTYEQVCGVVWGEKIVGHGHIPDWEIEWSKIHWLSEKDQWPLSVPLKPWPNGNNWKLEFKSYEQGRRALQARSIGGFMFSEQFPLDLFLETLRGCREYMFPGGQFAEFTPIEPELCLWVEKVMEDDKLANAGWKFYRCNTECNKENLAAGWFDQFFGAVPEEMLQTRLTGALATFEGVIYPSFHPVVHLVGDETIDPKRPAVWHYRGIDWGASASHPFVCVWGYRDGQGSWYVYDEYWSVDQKAIASDHARAIKERWPWQSGNPYWGSTFADPSRPDLINEFNRSGISTMPAANDVYRGIDCIRSKLKMNPATGQPGLYIHKGRCPHLAEEMRKYRWLKANNSNRATAVNVAAPRPAPLKKDDDCVDAERYMIFSVENSLGATPDSMRYKEPGQYRKSVQLAMGSRAMERMQAARTIGRNGHNGYNGNGNGKH